MSIDADATRSASPEVHAAASVQSIDPGAVFVDEPEQYEVESKIGMGGMGLVLAARGGRLGRTVAVKVITADREDVRARFQREAQVTARLQHPSIVPVYGTGQGKDGRPFYAMKKVSGRPLDQVIAETSTLAGRLALLPKVIAVSDAIAYAHSERVIHRDLKPANVLVGDFGETVVIDWGLAKNLEDTDAAEPAAADPYRTPATADGTAAGKVMGTPAYMPVEQARGERLDERSDVYALGAILYHVLAGSPPHARDDEASVPWNTMLARVLAAPARPLRELQPDLAPDLLAIVSRAMSPAPADRYPSANELAEDLKRFQTGQLVGAHRYSLRQLFARWVKRHKTAVTVGAIAIVALAVVAIVSVRRIIAEQAKTEEQRRVAVESRNSAEDLLAFMLGDLRDKLQPVGKVKLLDEVARKAVTYYDSRTDELSHAELVKRALARRNLGDVLKAQGQTADALHEYQASLAIATALTIAEPANTAFRDALATSQEKLGDALLAQNRAPDALVVQRSALELRTQLTASEPGSVPWQRDLGISHTKVAEVLLAQGEVSEAIAANRAALPLFREPLDRVLGHDKLGQALAARGDAAAASTEYRAALAIAEQEAKRDPANAEVQQKLSVIHERMADASYALGASAQGLEHLQQALALIRALAERDPANADRQAGMAVEQVKLGDALYFYHANVKGAEAEYRAAVAMLETLVKRDPTNGLRRSELAGANERLGNALNAQGKVAEALERYQVSLASRKQIVAEDPTNAGYQRSLSVAHNNLGNILLARGDKAGALAVYREGLAVIEPVAARDPTVALYQRDLLLSHYRIGVAQLETGDVQGALASFERCKDIAGPLAARDPSNVLRQADLGSAYDRLGDVYLARNEPAKALDVFRQLRDLNLRLAKDSSNAERMSNLARSQIKVGDALMRQADVKAALVEYRASLATSQALAAKDPNDLGRLRDAANGHSRLGDVLLANKDPAGAETEYRAALAIVAKIFAADRTNVDRLEDLAGSHQRVGNALLAAGNANGALAEYTETLKLIEGQAARQPAIVRWQVDLADASTSIGDAHAAGNKDAARASYNRALAILARVPGSDAMTKVVREKVAKLK